LKRLRGVHVSAFVVIVAACAPSNGPDLELGRRIAAEVSKGTGTVLRMADVAEFEWDTLYVFGPYSTRSSIASRVGFEWPQADRTGIRENEGIALLLFVRKGEVVRYVIQPRDQGDFANVRDSTGFGTDNAVFTVRPRGDGALALVPGS